MRTKAKEKYWAVKLGEKEDVLFGYWVDVKDQILGVKGGVPYKGFMEEKKAQQEKIEAPAATTF